VSNLLSMADVSSNNFPSNITAKQLRAKLQQMWDAGFRVLGVKCTEGTTYVWDLSHQVCAIWHSFGGIVNHYHFGHPGSVASGRAQADFFFNHVNGDWRKGDSWTFDAETKGESASEVNAFADRLLDGYHFASDFFTYGGPYFLRDNHIVAHRGSMLWLADYDDHVVFVPPSWHAWSIWQHTDKGSVPGLGHADLSIMKPEVIHLHLVRGDNNFAVERMAKLLKQHGYRGFLVNQKFGLGKRRAVKKFQAKHGWHQNGEVNAHMWQVLDKAA